MKYLFTVMILLAAGFAKAQIVNIPDSNFKFCLIHSNGVDVNGDGEIQESEALAITRLFIQSAFDPNIQDVTGISAFKNLRTLSCDARIHAIDLSNCTKLDSFFCSFSLLTQLDLSSCQKLSYLSLTHTKLNSFIPGILDSLKSVRLNYMSLDTLDLRNCKNLSECQLSLTRARNINMKGLSKLQNFLVNYDCDSIETVDLSDCTQLSNIAGFAGQNQYLSSLNVNGCTNLLHLTVYGSKLSYLDLSSCYNLNTLLLLSARVMDLNLKNGSLLTYYDNIQLLSGSNVCADDFEVQILKDRFYSDGKSVNTNSYCSFFPGGIRNTIGGKARLNASNNSCDSTRRAIPGVLIKISDTAGNTIIRNTVSSGDYVHYPYAGTFTLVPYFPYPYFNISPASATVFFDTTNNLSATRNFCIEPNGVHNDLEITFLPIWPPARPGFNTAYTVLYKNRGTTTLSGNVSVNFDNSKINFVSASENVTTQSTGQLTWNYNNLQPYESKTINVTFNLLPPPVNNNGDTITYLAAITPSANDETAFDNSFILPQRVRSAIDPNEKQCLEGDKLDITKISDYLHYQIHFQNEGTDTAFNVVVADTLSDKLDWNSLEPIGSSHPVDVKLTNNKAEFIFENINLPYKAINEPASNGYVAFKIKPKPSVVIGDSLNNKAAIYFDFNKPVITNTAATIVSSSSTPVPVKLEYFSVSTRNNSNLLDWKAACSYGNAIFIIQRSEDGIHFNSFGNVNATSVRCRLPFNFTDNNPVTGKNYYRLKITDADGISFYSKTIAVGNNKAGLEITAVANNIVYFNSNKQQTIQLKVIAADGKEILNERKTIAAGNNNISLQIKNAGKGIYTLIIYTNEGQTIIKRMLK